jgi:hypothetical protein
MKKGGEGRGEWVWVKVKIYRNNYQLGNKIKAIAENNMQRIQDLQMLLLAIFLMGKYWPGNFAHWKHNRGFAKIRP